MNQGKTVFPVRGLRVATVPMLFLIGPSGFMSCLLVGFLTQAEDPVSLDVALSLVLPLMPPAVAST